MKRSYTVIDQEVEALKKRGLEFHDEQLAKKIFLKENHYNIVNRYEEIFINLKQQAKNMYETSTYFEELYATYQFDRNLKELILDYINRLETMVNSYIAYSFSDKYGSNDYLKRENFISKDIFDLEFDRLITKINEQKYRIFNLEKNNVKQSISKCDDIPLWILIQSFTFGMTTNFYRLMKLEDKQEVAQAFQISPYSLGTYLKILNIVRNVCAHGDVLFDIRFHQKISPRDCNYHKALLIPKENNSYIYGINDMFAVIIILKKLLDEEDFVEMFDKVEQLLNKVERKLDSISYHNLLKTMGFPKNYEKIKNIV